MESTLNTLINKEIAELEERDIPNVEVTSWANNELHFFILGA